MVGARWASLVLVAMFVPLSGVHSQEPGPSGQTTHFGQDALRSGIIDPPEGIDVLARVDIIPDGYTVSPLHGVPIITAGGQHVAMAVSLGGRVCAYVDHALDFSDSQKREGWPCDPAAGFVVFDETTDNVLQCQGAEADEPVLKSLRAPSMDENWAVTPRQIHQASDFRDTNLPWGDHGRFICDAAVITADGDHAVMVMRPRGLGSPTPAGFVEEAPGPAVGASYVFEVELQSGNVTWSKFAHPLAAQASPAYGATWLVSLTATTTGYVAVGMAGPYPGIMAVDLDGDTTYTNWGGSDHALDVLFDEVTGRLGDGDEYRYRPDSAFGSQWAVANGNHAALVLGNRLIRFDPGVGAESVFVGPRQDNVLFQEAGGAWWGSHLLLREGNSLASFDPMTLTEKWRFFGFPDATLILPPDRFMTVRSWTNGDGDVRLHDLATGDEIRLFEETRPVNDTIPVGHSDLNNIQWGYPGTGVYVLPGGDEMLSYRVDGAGMLLGASRPEQRPQVSVDDRWPRPGGHVQVTVEVQPDVEYGIYWGTGPQESLPASGTAGRVYDEPGLHDLAVTAYYPDNTTATTVITIDVGGTAPADLNWFQKAAQPENYDLTFGVLGILIALLGSLFAVWRLRRRRGRIRQELEAIDRAYADAKNPMDRDTTLAERRAHVKGLLLDGKLDESQAGLLQRHIDGLARDARLASFSQHFDFLPHGFVRRLEEMLADGRISSWESKALTDLLEESKVTPQQKRAVKATLKEWTSRDAN